MVYRSAFRALLANTTVCLVVCAAANHVFADEAADAVRKWRDRTGTFSVDAVIVGVDRKANDPKVKLRKSDGTQLDVPYSALSDGDQKFAVAWFKAQNKKPSVEPPAKGKSLPKLPVVGDRVKIKWGSKWWVGEIMEVDGERFRFNYEGWDSYPDEWKTADQLRWEDDTAVIPGGPADASQSPKKGLATRPKPAANESADSKESKPATDSLASAKMKQDAPPTPGLSNSTPDLESSNETVSSFPPGLSPEETLAFLRKEATRGNLQVFWDWMPDNFRTYVTSQEQRDILQIIDQTKPKGLGADHFLQELVVVLKTKKDFVLANPIVSLLLEDQATINAFADVYDPATSLLDEVTQLLANVDEEIRGNDFDTALRARCDRIGKHVAVLMKAAPPDQLQAFWDRIVVQSQGSGGTLTMVYPNGAKKEFDLAQIDDRWIPQPLADSMFLIRDGQRAKAKEIESLSKPQLDGRIQGASMARDIKDAGYRSLAEKLKAAASAKTQGDFDAAIQQLLVSLQASGFLG